MAETQIFPLIELPVDSFDWIRWRNFDFPAIFGMVWRTPSILENRHVLQKYAIGYIDGSKLFCRPKPNTKAVMFLVNGEFQWCHLFEQEFQKVFGRVVRLK